MKQNKDVKLRVGLKRKKLSYSTDGKNDATVLVLDFWFFLRGRSDLTMLKVLALALCSGNTPGSTRRDCLGSLGSNLGQPQA